MADFIQTNPNPSIVSADSVPPGTSLATSVPPASSNPSPQPTVVSNSSNPAQPNTPVGANSYSSFFTGGSSGNGMDPNNFTSLLKQVGNNIQSNNTLVTQKQLLVKSLYDQKLTPEEMSQLPPTMQDILSKGPDAVALQIRVLNDQLQGRNNTVASSIDALTTGYENAQTNTQNAITSILNYAKSTGQPIENVAKALAPIYGLSVTNKMLNNLKVLGSTLLTSTQVPNETGASNSGSVVAGYDLGDTGSIGAYAADPNQPTQVRSINDQISQNFGTITDSQTADQAIQSLTPGSPITGDMIMASAQKYNVDPGVLISVMQNDSNLGTQGVGVSTMNPGNVGNTGSATNPLSSWQNGVDAVAENLAQRVTTGAQAVTAAPPDNSTPAAIKSANTPDPVTGVSKNAIYQAAIDYAFTEKMPSLGTGSAAAVRQTRAQILSTAGAIASAMGTSFPAMQALYKADSTAASQSVQRLARVASIENTLTNQMPRLASLADKVQSQGITLTEQDLQSSQAQITAKFGSTDAADYIELLNTIRSDYAAQQAALAGSRGGEFFANSAQQAFPLGYSGAQYLSLSDTIMQSAENIKDGINSEVQSLIGTSGGISTPTGTNSSGDYQAYLKAIGSK